MQELNEATDKAAFLRWLAAESLVAGLDDAEIHRICQRWIKIKIAAVAGEDHRVRYWYVRGRKDGLTGAPVISFEDAPDRWTDEEVEVARTAYGRGLDSAVMQAEEYAGLQFQIREAEGLVAWSVDPSRAHELLADLRAKLQALELEASK